MKNKIKFISIVFIMVFVLSGLFSLLLRENIFVLGGKRLLRMAGVYTEEISSVSINQDGYAFELSGSWNITKNSKWIDKGKAEISVQLHSHLKENDSKKDVIVVLDSSNNMNEEKMNQVKNTTKVLVDKVLENENHRMAMITFQNTGTILSNFSREKEQLKTQIDQITPENLSNYNSGLEKVLELLNGYERGDNQKVIVVFVTGGSSNLETNHERTTYQIIKGKFPYVTVQGIQYERGTELQEDIQNMSDYQFVANQKNLKEKMLEAALLPERFTTFLITEIIDSNYFEIDSVSANLGTTTIQNNEIAWDLSNQYLSGSQTEMKIHLSLKSEFLGEEGFYPLSRETKTVSQLPGQGERNIDSIKINVLQNFYQIIYRSNVPTGCENQDLPSEKYLAYTLAELKEPELHCVGYLFKGWEFDSEDEADIQKVNDGAFVMPGHNVTIRGTWGRFDILKNLDGTRGNTYFVTFDPQNGEATFQRETSKSIVLPEPSAVAGRAFIGWFDGDTEVGKAGDSYTPTKDVTLVGKWEVTVATFNYTGGEQSFTVPKNGYYRLEVWGAQGANFNTLQGGFGGYATSVVYLEKNQVLYVHVGGQGAIAANSTFGRGGYNGGGNGGCYSVYCGSGGGGATHMAFDRGVLSTLSAHATDDRILIVAGGGGGMEHNPPTDKRGSGGGYKGVDDPSECGVLGGTQTSGFAFGQGGDVGPSGNGGSGGGYYGGAHGYCFVSHGGAGGSGYIANTKTFSKHMTCYNCPTSTALSTKTITNSCYDDNPVADCAKKGHGYAKISDMGDSITKVTVTLDPRGGNVSTTTVELIYNDTYSGLPIPNYSGKVFVGWFTEDNVKITDSMKVDKSITKLYAKWDDGRAIEYIEIGNFTSNKTFTIDVKNYTDRYANITLDNFYMQNVKLETISGASNVDDGSIVLSNYDPSTGILTVHNASGRYGSYLSFILYVVFDIENANNLGGQSTHTERTINLQDKVIDYTALTKNNIFVKNAAIGFSTQNSSIVTNQCVGEYDPTTGDLKLLRAIYATYPTPTTRYQAFVNYQLYVFDGTLVKLN